TDLHIYQGEANYNMDERVQPVPLTRHPQILGHEISGKVVAVGAEVSDLREGDLVAIDQGLNCMSRGRHALCEYCASGDSHQCQFYAEHGSWPRLGTREDSLCLSLVTRRFSATSFQ